MNEAATLDGSHLPTALGAITLPSCPALLARVIREASAEDPNFQTITAAIEADPALGNGLLATVNSAAYGLSRKVLTVQAALMILGVRNAAMLITTLGVRQALARTNDVFLTRSLGACARTAALAAMVAQQLARVPRDLAHLYGLFRDCGVGLFCRLDREYAQALSRSGFLDTQAVANYETRQFGADHADAGGRLAALWSLPPAVVWAIRHHHAYADIDDYTAGPGGSGPTLVAIGLVADELAARLEQKTHPEWKDARAPFAHGILGIDDAKFEQLLTHAARVPFIPH